MVDEKQKCRREKRFALREKEGLLREKSPLEMILNLTLIPAVSLKTTELKIEKRGLREISPLQSHRSHKKLTIALKDYFLSYFRFLNFLHRPCQLLT